MRRAPRVFEQMGIVFMTGTPISNSAVEMYTMMRYLAADQLKELGLEHFDAWRTQSVSATPKWEPTEAGGLKEVTRLGRSWSNMRALMELYRTFAEPRRTSTRPTPKTTTARASRSRKSRAARARRWWSSRRRRSWSC
jgi:N12 class adenine-specific DNA methylase